MRAVRQPGRWAIYVLLGCALLLAWCAVWLGILNSKKPRVKWQYPAGGEHCQLAVAGDGTVYSVRPNDLHDWSLVALDARGRPKWEYQLWWDPSAGPALGADGTCYLLDYGGDDFLTKPAIGPDGTVYVSSKDGQLFALDPPGRH